MTDVKQEDVTHALEVLGLTLPVTTETLAQDQTGTAVYLEPRPLLKSDQQPQEIYAGLQKGRGDDQTHRSRLCASPAVL